MKQIPHFLSLADLSSAQLHALLQLAVDLKAEWRAGGNKPYLQGKSLALLFQKPSLRTRVSFEMGMVQLGGYALYLSPAEVQMGTREPVADVARVLSGYVDGIMARVFDHEEIVGLAAHTAVPVINGLSDYSHPAQALADLLTILECHGRLSGLKLTYVGDGNNVARSLLFGGMLTGMQVAIATPPGYGLSEEDYEVAAGLQTEGAGFEQHHDPYTAVAEANIIYTDTWTSMGQEAEKEARLTLFPPYQLNQPLLNAAAPGCLVMHCLPAYRGQEISDEVIEGPQSVVFQQAHNRLHAQKAILAHLLGGLTHID